MNYKISVIIPVYNAERYLRKSVESAVSLSQVSEVLLIEDASPDNALEVCKALEKEYTKVKLYRHPNGENRGAGASRNLGIENAENDLVAFLDADDYYLPNRFEKDSQIFKDHPDTDGVYGCTCASFENESVKNKFLSRYESATTTVAESINPPDLLYALLFGGKGRFHTNAITLKKKVFEKAGKFDLELKMAQDSELWARIAALCTLRPGQTEQPIAIRRVHEENRIHANAEIINNYQAMMYRKLFFWAVRQKQLSFSKKNYFFTCYRQSRNPKISVLKILAQSVIKQPALILTGFFYRKIYQILKK